MKRFYKIGDFLKNAHSGSVAQIVADSGVTDDGTWVFAGQLEDADTPRFWFGVSRAPSGNGQMAINFWTERQLDDNWRPCERPSGWPL